MITVGQGQLDGEDHITYVDKAIGMQKSYTRMYRCEVKIDGGPNGLKKWSGPLTTSLEQAKDDRKKALATMKEIDTRVEKVMKKSGSRAFSPLSTRSMSAKK
mmetsp:Transcript_111096/g.313423  ORF Transcript_111096/g.313423 Transcript_111096/m.313423 type:complete len:102 (-) Transcript_111096:98-403(-)